MEKSFIQEEHTITMIVNDQEAYIEVPIRWQLDTHARLEIPFGDLNCLTHPEFQGIFQWFAKNHEETLRVETVIAALETHGFMNKTPSKIVQRINAALGEIEKAIQSAETLAGDKRIPESIRLEFGQLYQDARRSMVRVRSYRDADLRK